MKMTDLKIKNIIGNMLLFYGWFFLMLNWCTIGGAILIALCLTALVFAVLCWERKVSLLLKAAREDREDLIARLKNKELDEGLANLLNQNGATNDKD